MDGPFPVGRGAGVARRLRMSCGRGRGSGTTGGRCTSTARRRSSSPSTAAGCRRLSRRSRRCPGVGPYTARAVAAIAFGEPVGAVDVNVRRVLGRIVAGGPEAFTADRDAGAGRRVGPSRPGRGVDARAHGRRPARVQAFADRTVRTVPRSPGADTRAGERPVVGPSARPRRPDPAFESTNRWLRGRIVDRARGAPGWIPFGEPIGDHGEGAVRTAVLALARDGLLEVRETPTTARGPPPALRIHRAVPRRVQRSGKGRFRPDPGRGTTQAGTRGRIAGYDPCQYWMGETGRGSLATPLAIPFATCRPDPSPCPPTTRRWPPPASTSWPCAGRTSRLAARSPRRR